MLNEVPYRGTAMPPTDPLIYRFYEMVMVNGPAWKALIGKVCGEGRPPAMLMMPGRSVSLRISRMADEFILAARLARVHWVMLGLSREKPGITRAKIFNRWQPLVARLACSEERPLSASSSVVPRAQTQGFALAASTTPSPPATTPYRD